MNTRFQTCARAILLTPDGHVLLLKIRGWTRDLWITPGGRIRAGEDPLEAVARELLEETGRSGFAFSSPVWVRCGSMVHGDVRIDEQEVFYLVRTERFEPSIEGLEPEERAQHLGFRWWSIPEIAESGDAFVPRRLAAHLSALPRTGSPLRPLDVSD